ncbi:tail assembly protein [Escherichia coli]|nr:tail assembly protein [Escherichia coli]EHW2803654.1 tail assembly protein [Escherichia coli]EJF8200281.1 tail assembly protein [Escherichia coli]EJR8127755.1 tail assembly protein [Escherichia coli]EJZ2138205.1 tail assembly protein [Escherichia coli]
MYVNTAAEAIRALSLQMPGFRRQMNEGWYQIRIPTASQNRSPAPVFVVMSGEYLLDKKEEIIQ